MFGGLFRDLSARRARGVSAPKEETWEGDPFAATLRLNGEMIYLRPLDPEDAEAMFAYASDPQVTRYLPWEPADSVESVRPFLIEQATRRQRRESLGFAIIYREDDSMIGSTDLMDLLRTRGQAELGYLLARPYWGMGIMTEAARLSLEHAFGPMKLGRVLAFADVENRGSRRVLEKLGMRVSGSEIRTVHGEGRLYIRYEIRRADWLAQQK